METHVGDSNHSRGREDGWSGHRARGTGRGSCMPRGGMRRRVPPAAEPPRSALPAQHVDEGEINSDGEGVDGAGGADVGRVWSGSSHSTPARASSPGSARENQSHLQDGRPRKGSERATTGLVDYGSSSDSD